MLVNAPLSEATASELRSHSDDLSDEVMVDLTHAILARIKQVDRAHDIPYIAGYSQNGEKIYIDRHMPKSFIFEGKRVHSDRFIILHEAVEKALLDELALNYLHAHQIALRTEKAAVEAAGIAWKSYNQFTKKYQRQISDERLKKVPDDLDLTPYRNERDFETLRRMIGATPPEAG